MNKLVKAGAVCALVAAVAACDGKKVEDPVKTAIQAAVAEQLGEVQKMDFVTLELVDSSTFAQEIERRRSTLETRHQQNVRIAGNFESENKPRNAQKAWEKAGQDEKNLEGLSRIEERMASHDSLGLTELYIYKFSAYAKLVSGTKSEMRDFYAGITPDGRVVGLSQKELAIYKGTGALLPGYRELFDE